MYVHSPAAVRFVRSGDVEVSPGELSRQKLPSYVQPEDKSRGSSGRAFPSKIERSLRNTGLKHVKLFIGNLRGIASLRVHASNCMLMQFAENERAYSFSVKQSKMHKNICNTLVTIHQINNN